MRNGRWESKRKEKPKGGGGEGREEGQVLTPTVPLRANLVSEAGWIRGTGTSRRQKFHCHPDCYGLGERRPQRGWGRENGSKAHCIGRIRSKDAFNLQQKDHSHLNIRSTEYKHGLQPAFDREECRMAGWRLQFTVLERVLPTVCSHGGIDDLLPTVETLF